MLPKKSSLEKEDPTKSKEKLEEELGFEESVEKEFSCKDYLSKKFPGLAIPNKIENNEEIDLEWDDVSE